jgi:hypothetical protein
VIQLDGHDVWGTSLHPLEGHFQIHEFFDAIKPITVERLACRGAGIGLLTGAEGGTETT